MCAYYAHSTDKSDKSDWQDLATHLVQVAERAESFASVFGARDWGRLAGLFHDAGKATGVFTARLEGKPVRVDHST
jgi:CRISPR-associated endonuclease/helicase Cas3